MSKCEFTVKEKYGEPRINTRLIQDWEGKHGTLCLTCKEFLSNPFGPCKCQEDKK